MSAIGASLILGFFILCLFLYYAKKKNKKPLGFPPGPPTLPILGSSLFMPRKVWYTGEVPISDYLNDKYGDVAGLYKEISPVIFVSDPKIVRKLLKMEESSGRPMRKPFHKLRYGDNQGRSRGLLFSSGQEWKEQRRFSMRTLKDFGFGKTSMEDDINQEVQKLVSLLREKHLGTPVHLNGIMNLSIVNALWVLMVGEKLALDDKKLLSIVKALDSFIRHRTIPNPVWALFGPWAVERFDPLYKNALDMFNSIKNMVKPYIVEHKKATDESDEDRDFVDAYIKAINQSSDSSSSFHGARGEESLVSSLLDLFLAGTETTTSSLMWGILFLLHNPEVQDKLHSELESVLGDKETVDYEERSNLPYTCAVINEIHRCASIVRTAIPHSMTEDVMIDGHSFPKGAIVLPNLIKIHHDKRLWSNPNKFDPERFYDRETGACLSSENLMPFSVGKRYCLGQSLAEKELFMFFVGLVKAFKFEVSEKDGIPDCGYNAGSHVGIIRIAPLYKVILRGWN